MNYFAQGRTYTDDPYFLVGTAVPDMLNVVDRKIRVRSNQASPYLTAEDGATAAIAAGVVQHHHDDAWFHRTRAFAELSLNFSVAVRDILGGDESFRSHFLGHILVEILLDSELIENDPSQLQLYYDALKCVDASKLADVVTFMSGRHAIGLAWLLPRFIDERFLWDYPEDEKLLKRLNQVMRRVRLPLLPEAFLQLLPGARAQVRMRHEELLTPVAVPKIEETGTTKNISGRNG
jgi:hypothetical protein